MTVEKPRLNKSIRDRSKGKDDERVIDERSTPLVTQPHRRSLFIQLLLSTLENTVASSYPVSTGTAENFGGRKHDNVKKKKKMDAGSDFVKRTKSPPSEIGRESEKERRSSNERQPPTASSLGSQRFHLFEVILPFYNRSASQF